MSSTSSDSETDYITPLTGLRKEELIQKERELQRSKKAKELKNSDKKQKRKRKKR